jgi:hypothetical protein
VRDAWFARRTSVEHAIQFPAWQRVFGPASAMPPTASSAGFFGRFLLRRLGLRWRRPFTRFLHRGGFFAGTRGGRRFLFSRLFVGIASIIRGVKPRSFEDQPGAGAEQALYFAVTPLRQPAKLFWAFAEWLVAHRLKRLESLAALLTRILVRWHEGYRSARSAGNAGKCALNNPQFNPSWSRIDDSLRKGMLVN